LPPNASRHQRHTSGLIGTGASASPTGCAAPTKYSAVETPSKKAARRS
jgi:hypothetical protein